MHRLILLSAALLALVCSVPAVANVTMRVIDTGPGLATITRFPDGSIMVYDTGHFSRDDAVFNEFQDFLGEGDEIDLLIASHTDADHIGATDELFNVYRIHRVIRTGHERETQTWENHTEAIEDAAEIGLTHDINLNTVNLPHGTEYRFGDAVVTYLAGFHDTPDDWGVPSGSSEFRNANSIVVRIQYEDNGILLTGDAVGRDEGNADNTPAIATENYLIQNRNNRPIDAEILFAPHHGGDDASSNDFINAVNPRWVIFSAGHQHDHPLQVTADRYLNLGFAAECLLRTDLGDDESGNDEWSFGRVNGEQDPAFDNAVIITLPVGGGDPTAVRGTTACE